MIYMYIKIYSGENKGSANKLFSYLTKENEAEGKPDDFFNHCLLGGGSYADLRASVYTPEERKAETAHLFFREYKMADFMNDFDKHSAVSVSKNSPKFYMVVISPSHKELCNLAGVDHRHVSGIRDLTSSQKATLEKQLKCYTNDVMAKYAQAFGRKDIQTEKDLLYYAKIEHSRIYRHYHSEVIEGKKRCGDEKEGLNHHVHVVVSRKSADGKSKLSPLNNNTSKRKEQVSWENGDKKMQRGFQLGSFQKEASNEFYHMYYEHVHSKIHDKESGYYGKHSKEIDPKSSLVMLHRKPLSMVKVELEKQLVDKEQKQRINLAKGSIMSIVSVVRAVKVPSPIHVIKAAVASIKTIGQIKDQDFEK